MFASAMQKPPAEGEVLAVCFKVVSVEVLDVIVISVLQGNGGRLCVCLRVCETDHGGKVGAAAEKVELDSSEDVEEGDSVEQGKCSRDGLRTC